jgi:acyl-CoA thioesterase
MTDALDLALASTPRQVAPDRFTLDTSSDWYQGRGVFGGVIFAAAARAMTTHVNDPSRPLRSLNVEVFAPLQEGTATLHVHTLRAGKNVSTVMLHLNQDSANVAAALAQFGAARSAEVDFDEAKMPHVLPPEAVAPIESAMLPPRFARHFEFRPCLGPIPYTGATEATSGGWVQAHKHDAPTDAAWMLALIDTWWPAALPRLSTPKAMSTLSFHAHVLAPAPSDGPLLVEKRSTITRDGYSDEDNFLWSRDGRLLLKARQVVALL